jgi:hypothetical protein
VVPANPQTSVRRHSLAIAAVAAGVVGLSSVLGVTGLVAARSHGSGPAHRTPLSAGPRVESPKTNGLPTYPPGPAAGHVVVTQRIAADAVRRYWPVHAEALVRRDTDTLARLTTGAARSWEVSAVDCGCLYVRRLRPLLAARYFVPRQTSYPSRFVVTALTRSTQGPQEVEILVFTRRSAGSRWLVAEDSGYPAATSGPTLGVPDNGADGFNRPAGRAVRARARGLASAYAAALQQAKDTGHVGTIAFTAQPDLALVAEHRQDGVQRNGLLGHYRYYTRARDRLAVATFSDGYVLACQPVRLRVEYTGQSGAHVYQDPLRRNWGRTLAPGIYRSITEDQAWQTCFVLSDDAGQPVLVLNPTVTGEPQARR